jgi:hypothetical protein
LESALTDLSTPTTRLCDLLSRAALDGHTALPWDVVVSALASGGVDADAAAREAVATGRAVAVLLGDLRAIALTEHVVAEQRVADAVGELVEHQRLRVVVGSSTPDDAAALSDLHLLGSAKLADRLESVASTGDAEVMLRGDPDLLGPFGPGQPFRDLVAGVQQSAPRLLSAAARNDATSPVLGDLVAALRRGDLPAVPSDQHQVVRTAAPNDAALAERVEQVVTDSIPRTFSLHGEQVGVVTPMRLGACGADALKQRLGDAADVALLTDLRTQTWPALVAVWPAVAAGVLDRPSLLSMVTRGREHVSIAYTEGMPLRQIVRLGHRPRVTILPTLLAQSLARPVLALPDTAHAEEHNRRQSPGLEVS